MVAINRNPPTCDELAYEAVERRYEDLVRVHAITAAMFGVLCPILLLCGLKASSVTLVAFTGLHLGLLWGYHRRLRRLQRSPLGFYLRVYRGEHDR